MRRGSRRDGLLGYALGAGVGVTKQKERCAGCPGVILSLGFCESGESDVASECRRKHYFLLGSVRGPDTTSYG